MSIPESTMRPKSVVRGAGLVLAGTVAIYSLWILVAALLMPAALFDDTFPPEIAQTEIDVVRTSAAMAAQVGALRGDLWSKRSLVDAAPVFSSSPSLDKAQTRATLTAAQKAVSLAPIEPRAWLILAALAAKEDDSSEQGFAPLKMSYYTGPNERTVMTERISLAMGAGAFKQPELADAMRREIRAILRGAPDLRPVIANAYRHSGAAGREFILSAIASIDGKFLDELRRNP